MSHLTRRALLGGAVAFTLLPIADALLAGATAQPIADFDRMLKRYVVLGSDRVARVDYAAWQKNQDDRAALIGVVAALAAARPSTMAAAEQFAFWSNLYNALTLIVVLEAYPVDSIKRIKSKGALLDFKRLAGPWRTKLVVVEGQRMSLDDIEHGTMRPRFRDPRVHYAVNCASIGCPNLRPRAWRAGSLEAALDAAARAYVNSPRGATVDSDGRLIVSSLYRWYVEDFGGDDAGIIRHLRLYAEPPLAVRLQNASRIAGDRYDWSLNDARRVG